MFVSQTYHYREQSALAVSTIPLLVTGIPGLLPEQPTPQPTQSGSIQPQTSEIKVVASKQEIQRNVNYPDDTSTVIRSIPNMNNKSNNNVNQIIPRTFLVDPVVLANTKQSIAAQNNVILQTSLDQLLKEANTYLPQTPPSVVEKTQLPPSGDKHDYLSISKYWWPDPSKPNGLPYIRHDGKVNPEFYSIPDKSNLEKMIDSVKTLSLSYYFTNDIKYAEKAAQFLRTWFLDSNTHMNPNLNYAQTVPGMTKLKSGGIIDTHNLPAVVDSIGLIQNSRVWTQQDQSGITQWFTQFQNWLLNSEAGKDESQHTNNHGTWYDAQVVPIALFLNKTDMAKSIIQNNTENRLVNQIQSDGSQPIESKRTKSLSYSIFNLAALFELANTARHVQIDLWNYKTTKGVGLRNALDYVIPYLDGNVKSWPYQQITQLDTHDFKDAAGLLYQAAAKYHDHSYLQSYNSILQGRSVPTSINNLLYGTVYQ